VKSRTSQAIALIISLILCNSSQAQVERRTGEVRGNLRLEVVTVPNEISKSFERLNPQVLLYHPHTGDSEKNSDLEKSPLMIFLHGSGGANGSVERFKWKGDVKRFTTRAEGSPPVHILVPQSKGHWDPVSLNKMLDYVLKKNPSLDSNRVYCIGYSMGGKGTWEWAMASPDRFAAIIPKAFIPDMSGLAGMVELPLWAMVGTKDSKPRVDGIRTMEKRLKELGSKVVKTTYFEGANHGSAAGEIKKLDGVYDWLFSHKLPR
jgi:predicted peptidase